MLNEEQWPFFHLNLVYPASSSSKPDFGSHDQASSSSVTALEQSFNNQLEAWTKIDFSFDDPPPPLLVGDQFESSNNPSTKTHSNPSFPSLLSSSPHLDHSPPFLPPFVYEANENQHAPAQPPSEKRLASKLPAPSAIAKLTTAAAAKTPDKRKTIHEGEASESQSWKKARSVSTPSTISFSFSQSEDNMSPLKALEVSPEDEEAHRAALEDDKRRRNTLASARFRMKKKMKEQEIERTAKELKDRVIELEKQLEGLQQENKWLRGLIVDQASCKFSHRHSRASESPA